MLMKISIFRFNSKVIEDDNFKEQLLNAILMNNTNSFIERKKKKNRLLQEGKLKRMRLYLN